MVKLKEDKQVGQNFVELKHMAVVILFNYLKTKEMLKNCETRMCFDSANLQETGAARKRAGGGR